MSNSQLAVSVYMPNLYQFKTKEATAGLSIHFELHVLLVSRGKNGGISLIVYQKS